jgi:tetratricopeptide (TPR) repeat protein
VAQHAALAFERFDSAINVALMIQASRAALQRLSWSDAIRFCECVLVQARPSDDEKMHLHHLAGLAYHQTAQIDRALAHLVASEAIANARDDRKQLAWILWERIRIEINFGRTRPGEGPNTALLESLLGQFQQKDAALEGRLLVTMSNSRLVSNRAEEAAVWAGRARMIAAETLDSDLYSYSSGAAAMSAWELVRPAAALQAWQEGQIAAKQHPSSEARCWQRIPLAHLMLGQMHPIPDAAARARQTSTSARVYGTGELTLTIVAEVGWALVRGDLQLASRLSREGLDLMRDRYVGASEWLLTAFAYASVVLDDLPAATDALERIMRPGAVFHDPAPLERAFTRYSWLVRAVAGERDAIALQIRSVPAPRGSAGEHLRRMISHCVSSETAWECGAWDVGARCLPSLDFAAERGLILTPGWPFLIPRLRGCAAAMAGETERALHHFGEAIEVCEKQEMQAELGKVHLAMAKLNEAATPESSRTSREMARRIFESLGMIRHLEMLEEIGNGTRVGSSETNLR